MTKNIANSDLKTIENLTKDLSLEKRLDEVIAVWEKDSKAFEELDCEIDLENEMYEVLNDLESKNLLKEIERLDRALQCQPKRYKVCCKYISSSLIPLYLAEDRESSKEQKSRIENYLKDFYKNPVQAYGVMSSVLYKLICYDQSSIVVDLCRKIYKMIAKSNKFFINPKNDIGEIIIWDELQDAYLRFKKNMAIDWGSYNKKFKTYEFIFTQDDFNRMEEVMKGHLDPTQMFHIFKNNNPLAHFLIRLSFCCQMYDLDGTSFVTSNYFASIVTNFLFQILGRERCPMNVFFKIKPNLLASHVRKLISESLFDATYLQFAFLGALPIFYLVLLKIGLIESKIVEGILPAAIVLKSEYKNKFSGRPWSFNFIKKLEEQSSLLTLTCQHQA